MRTLLTEKYQESFADKVIVPGRNVVPKPPSLSHVTASVMGTAWLTAYRMLLPKSGLRPGRRCWSKAPQAGCRPR